MSKGIEIRVPCSLPITYYSPDREDDTVYQNTSGRTKIVLIAAELKALSIGDSGLLLLMVSSASDPSVGDEHGRINLWATGGTLQIGGSCAALVPPAWYYAFYTSLGGDIVYTRKTWVEMSI